MPCRSDYMDPTESEKNSKRTCELIAYANNSLHKHTPDWILEAANNQYGNEYRLEEAVQILCAICTNMNETQKNSIIYNGRDKTARNLADWWEEHLEADRIRLLKEKKNREAS